MEGVQDDELEMGSDKLALDIRAGRGQILIMKRIIPSLLLLVLCGCGAGYEFSPYYGAQQNWSTSPGGYTKLVNGATLYPPGQLPNRPYNVVGSVSTDSYENVAKAVREHAADAALVYTDSTVRTGTVAMGGPVLVPGPHGVYAGPDVFWGIPIDKRTVNAQLIRYK